MFFYLMAFNLRAQYISDQAWVMFVIFAGANVYANKRIGRDILLKPC